MYEKVGRYVLRYLICIGIPYLIAKQIEIHIFSKMDLETKLKLNKEAEKFQDLENISEGTRNGLNNRGGASPVLFWLAKIITQDFAIKVGFAGGIFGSIWGTTADNAAAVVAKYGSAMLAAPGRKFKYLYKKLTGLDVLDAKRDIREILLDKELTNVEKLELLKVRIQQCLKNLKTSKRKQFILFIIATLLFSQSGNVAAFAWFMERLRAILGGDNPEENDEHIRNALIDIYREYNAPLPKELMPPEILDAMKNLK